MPSDCTWSLSAAQQNCSELRNCRQNLLPAPVQPFRRPTSQNHWFCDGELQLWSPDPIFTALLFRRKMCSRALQGRLISLAAHMPPRRPTCISIRNLQVRMALTLRKPSILAFRTASQGVGTTPKTGPGPPRRPTCIFTCNLQVRLALTLRKPSMFKHSGRPHKASGPPRRPARGHFRAHLICRSVASRLRFPSGGANLTLDQYGGGQTLN